MTIKTPPKKIPQPKVYKLSGGKQLVRFYNPLRYDWNQPRHYGPLKDQRFDHHPQPKQNHLAYSVWYAGSSLRGAVAEAFGRIGFVDQSSERRICVVEVVDPLPVIDLVGNGARFLGLDQEIATTTDYEKTCLWARHLYHQFSKYAGIRWHGRQMGTENVVLNDRANLSKLSLISDHKISEPEVWPRIKVAAYYCKIKVVGIL